MIHAYFISYRNYNYVKKSLDSILESASEKIIVNVAHNPDYMMMNSGHFLIKEMLEEYVDSGKIERALIFANNNIGWSLVQAMRDFPPDDSEKFFVMSDLDLVVPSGCDWIKEIRQAYAAGGVLTGFGLDLSNHLDPNDGHSELSFGNWIMAPNTKLYQKHFGYDRNTIDSQIVNTFASLGTVYKLNTRLIHLAWDLHKPREEGGDPEYAAAKKAAGPNWVLKPKPDNMSYTLIERIKDNV